MAMQLAFSQSARVLAAVNNLHWRNKVTLHQVPREGEEQKERQELELSQLLLTIEVVE